MAEGERSLSDEALQGLPEALATPPRRAALPLIWLVPLVAVLIGGWLAVRAVLERGPTITITFSTADGLEPGKTKVKYKNVDVGELRGVVFTEDRARVVATVELTRQAESMLVDDTRFWVVRPRVTGSQVSGLTTLLSGSYIGMDVGRSEQSSRAFVGLETPPIVTLGLPGRLFDLQASDLGSLDIGSPVYLRRVRVGQVVAFELKSDGSGVAVTVFVNAPYDQYVGRTTRFWHASGFDLALDAAGLRLNTESLATLILGGVAFETPAGLPVTVAAPKRTEYRLYADRAHAMKLPDTAEETFVLVFDESVRGLLAGAPVDFRGVVIGEVTAISVQSNSERGDLTIPVRIRLYPQRLSGTLAAGGPDADENLMDALVQRGLRAQLRTGNLLTGQLYVALDYFPHAARARLDRDVEPPRIPTVAGSMNELQDTLRNAARRIEKFPLESIAADLRKALASADATMRRLDATLSTANGALRSADQLAQRLDAEIAPDVRAALADARRTLSAAERILTSDAPVQRDLRETLRQVGRAAAAMRAVADYLERHPDALLRGRQEEP
jgi:paraquat-inducible protein B